MPALQGLRLPTFAPLRVLLAIRVLLVQMFQLMWSPVTSQEEMDKHDMSLNARAVFALVTVVVIGTCFVLFQ